MSRTPLTVRPSILVVSCLVLVMMAATGSTCSKVEDPSKTDLQIQLVNSCVQDCNAAARTARDAEQVLHQQNVAACQALPSNQRGPCLEAEDARHDARMDEIASIQESCKDACEHSQGGLVIGE
jgi:hypothetical protein